MVSALATTPLGSLVADGSHLFEAGKMLRSRMAFRLAGVSRVDREELVRLMGLLDAARTADHNIHAELLENPGLGSERDQIRRIGPGQVS
jgi:hypothetical protein